jgi:DHA3 family macrolide efflux protein-like MFS transporter
MSVGEVIGLYIVSKNGQKVSRLFKISMLGNALCMLSLIFIDNVFAILMIFGLYGLLDSLTQPLFSYTITTIDSENRGKILGGIDTIILISPSLGMYIFTKIMNVNKELGYTGIAAVFIIALLIILFSHDLNSIEVSSNSMQSAESASNLD